MHSSYHKNVWTFWKDFSTSNWNRCRFWQNHSTKHNWSAYEMQQINALKCKEKSGSCKHVWKQKCSPILTTAPVLSNGLSGCGKITYKYVWYWKKTFHVSSRNFLLSIIIIYHIVKSHIIYICTLGPKDNSLLHKAHICWNSESQPNLSSASFKIHSERLHKQQCSAIVPTPERPDISPGNNNNTVLLQC